MSKFVIESGKPMQKYVEAAAVPPEMDRSLLSKLHQQRRRYQNSIHHHHRHFTLLLLHSIRLFLGKQTCVKGILRWTSW